jgi:hypothetical protein
VDPRAGLDVVVKRKIPSHYRDSNPRSSSPQPSAIPLSYPGSYRNKGKEEKKKEMKYKRLKIEETIKEGRNK